MNLEQTRRKEFDFEEDEGEEKPFILPDEAITVEEIETGNEVIIPLHFERPKSQNEISPEEEEKLSTSIEEDIDKDFDKDFDIDGELDNLEREYNSCLPKKSSEIEAPRLDETINAYLIENLQPKPDYTWIEYQDFFPCASIEYLKKIYLKKSFAGKVFEVIMVEAAKTLAFNIQGKKRHLHVDATNNIWIPLEKIYSKTYRGNTKQIQAAMEIIARVLNGKLKYRFTTEGSKRKGYLVLDIGAGVLTNTFKDFVQVFPEDYKLTNAELVFLRSIQVGLFRNNEQTFKLSTLLEYGKIAWKYDRCKKEQQEKTLNFIERLGKEGRFAFKEIDKEKGKYFVKDLKAKGRKVK